MRRRLLLLVVFISPLVFTCISRILSIKHVFFTDIHGHRQPVVLLERLRTNPDNTLINHNNGATKVVPTERKYAGDNSDAYVKRLRSHDRVDDPINDVFYDCDSVIEHGSALEIDFILTEPYPPLSGYKNMFGSNFSDVSIDEDKPLAYLLDDKIQSSNKKTKKRQPKKRVQRRRKNKLLKKPAVQKEIKKLSGSRRKKNTNSKLFLNVCIMNCFLFNLTNNIAAIDHSIRNINYCTNLASAPIINATPNK